MRQSGRTGIDAPLPETRTTVPGSCAQTVKHSVPGLQCEPVVVLAVQVGWGRCAGKKTLAVKTGDIRGAMKGVLALTRSCAGQQNRFLEAMSASMCVG
jgi:hypothetical protein